MAQFGPLSVRFRDDGIDLGLVVGAKHLNHQGVVHGGVVASMADTVMAFHSARAAGYAVATVSMNIDYLAAVREGSWMEVRSRIDRKGSRMVFVACDGVVDETPAFRASAVFSAVRVRSVA
ncbi:PaaI family thioesterase [Piscinibacter sp.]|uniref:PaaI family thioesterase n=1 Tax=Piscinibacter sp. TaxID=1903157 RepID=UPI0035AF5AA7